MTELIANSPTPGSRVDLTTVGAPGINATATTLPTMAAVPSTGPASVLRGPGQFRIVVWDGTHGEIMLVTAGQTGTSWTVTRGSSLPAPDTCPSYAFAAGAQIFHVPTAGSLSLGLPPLGTTTPELFGAKGDGTFLYQAQMTAGSNIVNATDAQFAASDVGKTILVSGVGAGNDAMAGTIQQVNSPTQAQVSFAAVNASPDPAGCQIAVYGTDDTAAIQAASDAAAAGMSGRVRFDSKVYMVCGALQQAGARKANAQITLPNRSGGASGAGTAGVQKLVWSGARDGGGSPAMPFPAAAGTVLVSTMLGAAYSATYGIPSVIGGPTQEQQSAFSICAFDIEDMQIIAPRDPSIAGVNCESMYAHSRRRITVGTLEWGYSQSGLETLAIAEPTHPQAAAMIDPRTTNFQGGAGHNEQVSSWGFFAGIVPSEHGVYTTTRVFNTKIPLAVRADANQRVKGFTHAASFKYLSAEGNPYLISGWDPTAASSAAGVTAVPNAQALFLVDEVDIEDYSDTTVGAAWAVIVNHVNDTANKLTGDIGFTRWSWVSGTFTKMTALVLNGGTQLSVRQRNSSLAGWQTPALGANWSNIASGNSTAAYRKDPNTGMVKLKGNVKSTAASPDATVIFSLPAGFRPLQNQNFVVYAYGSATSFAGVVQVAQANGAITVALGATNTCVSLDGISFLAEQ